LEKSKEILSDVTKKAVDALEKFGEKADFLRSLAKYCWKGKIDSIIS